MWQIFLRKYYYCQFFRSVSLFGTCPNLLCNREREREKEVRRCQKSPFLGKSTKFFFLLSHLEWFIRRNTERDTGEKKYQFLFFWKRDTHSHLWTDVREMFLLSRPFISCCGGPFHGRWDTLHQKAFFV